MSPILLNVLAGFALAVVVSLAAWKAHSLSNEGALAATVLGTIVFGLGGLGWAVLLLGFFVSSSALSRLFRRRKAALDEKFSKGSRRDAGQVFANGGIAGIFVLLHIAFPDQAWPWAAFAGTLAAANADTWATELGVLNRTPPRMVTTGKQVERGTSGGVSPLGFLASMSGALVIAALAVLFWQGHAFSLNANAPAWLARLVGAGAPALKPMEALLWLAAITGAGMAGSLLDSTLGATAQGIFFCPSCQKETERHPLHSCGTQTVHLRGYAWLDNDLVNLACTLAGGLIALLPALI